MQLDPSELQELRSSLHKTILRERNRFEKGHCLGLRLAKCEALYEKITTQLSLLEAA